MMNKEL